MMGIVLRILSLTAIGLSGPPSAAATTRPAVVLYSGEVRHVEPTLERGDGLWIRPAELPRVNGFELKPEGACLDDLCVPVGRELFHDEDGETWFDVTGLAQKLGQVYAHDPGQHVFSFGLIPYQRASFLESALAPDFELPDRQGKRVRLSDFRGKKVLLLAWASW